MHTIDTLLPTTSTSTSTSTHSTAGETATGARRAGWVITGAVTLFLGFDSVIHLLRESSVMEYNARVGAPDWFPLVCGAVLATCLLAYHVPATRPMGTVLITAYLGGATAVNLVTEAPAFNTGFAIATAVAVWAGAWPRDERLRALVGR